jgi:sulfatase modifying factor 1
MLSVSDDGSARVWAAPAAEAFDGMDAAERLCVAAPTPVERVVAGAKPGEVCIVGTGPEGFVSGEDKGKQVVKDVCLDITEVTVAAYGRCVASGKCTKPDEGEYCNEGKEGRGSHPVNCVDLAQAKAYCKSVGKRLPTEWEWEWAARGRDEGRTYPWGKQAPSCARAVMDDGGDGCGKDRTWPVGSKPNGNSRDGLKDMAGNVYEWTSSKYDSDFTVIRGGSWSHVDPIWFRAAYRNRYTPAARIFYLGFRCARTPPE